MWARRFQACDQLVRLCIGGCDESHRSKRRLAKGLVQAICSFCVLDVFLDRFHFGIRCRRGTANMAQHLESFRSMLEERTCVLAVVARPSTGRRSWFQVCCFRHASREAVICFVPRLWAYDLSCWEEALRDFTQLCKSHTYASRLRTCRIARKRAWHAVL